MSVGFERRLLAIWLALSAVTFLQPGIGALEGRSALAGGSVLTAGVIAIALIKVRIILREFMEVRHAPVLLGRLTDGWIVLTGAILLAGHLAGTLLARG